MASLKKRGKYYYIKFFKTEDGERRENVKSLGIKYKKEAEKALDTLEELEGQGAIDPYHKDFDPKHVLKELNSSDKKLNINTVRQAADYFYQRKSHLSNATIRNPKNRTLDNSGAYERAIEHFITKNDIAGLSPLMVRQQHFDNVIFKPGIKPATRHFYFKQLRVWWNKLIDWGIVDRNFFPDIKKDLPKKRSNTKSKMMSEQELQKLFTTFDKELERKKERQEYDESQVQHWFKPLISIYFYCGLRKHEAAYKSDIDYSGLQGQNLYFENDRLEMIYLSTTKGPNERAIPVPDPCRKLVEQYLERRGEVGYNDYLFIYQGGRRKGYPVTGERAYRQFKHYLKLANLPSERTLHGMRHERITSWLENGYNTSEAQFMAGHSRSSQTDKYTHLRGKRLLEKQRKMDKKSD